MLDSSWLQEHDARGNDKMHIFLFDFLHHLRKRPKLAQIKAHVWCLLTLHHLLCISVYICHSNYDHYYKLQKHEGTRKLIDMEMITFLTLRDG